MFQPNENSIITATDQVADRRVGNVIPLRAADQPVREDLLRLAALMPEHYRQMFSLRWGLDGPVRSLAEIAEIVGSTAGKVSERLEVCLWHCHRAAQHEQVPAIQGMLGRDRREWAANAWAHSVGWQQIASRIAETRLLLAIGGMDVPQIQQIIGEHLTHTGVLDANPWGAPLTRGQRAELAGPVIDRLLEHTIWPGTPRTEWDPSMFAAKRTFDTAWIGMKGRGYFHSRKLDRMVMYESPLERDLLRHLDADERVAEILEQPFTIAAVYGARQHLYTPDILVRLTNGRVLVIEVKGPVRVGEFGHWMRWTALARHCEMRGYGLHIGNTQTGSILDHQLASRNSPYRHLVRALAEQGAHNRSDNYRALLDEDPVLIAQAVTAEMLAWTPGTKGGITRPDGLDLEKARGFWQLIATHSDRIAT